MVITMTLCWRMRLKCSKFFRYKYFFGATTAVLNIVACNNIFCSQHSKLRDDLKRLRNKMDAL